jgi:hypothetical protein
MTTIYAVFLCSIVGNQQICSPTAFKNDPTQAACDAHRHYMAALIKPGVTIVCMKKSVPTWEPVH